MLFFISFADGVEVQPWRVFEVRLPSLAATLRIQVVRFLLSLLLQLHKIIAVFCQLLALLPLLQLLHKMMAAFFQFLALPLFGCHFHILVLNHLLKQRILPAKRLHLLGVRFSTLLLNVQHEPH